MNAIAVRSVNKKFGERKVVEDLSFDLSGGEIMGLIGPNGAGKTTTIRMVMDVIKPDSGSVLVLGEKFSDQLKNEVGYLPEERGLYRKVKILDTMAYLASLKGMNEADARRQGREWLKRVGLLAHENKKIEELSHGMGQIIQFLATILHGPRVIILDEPFTGLDPVNVKMVKDVVLELKGQGAAFILSTHRMNEVEEMCDQVLMINQGRAVLSGNLREIKAGFRRNAVLVDVNESLDSVPGARVREIRAHNYELTLEAGTTAQQVLAGLVAKGLTVNRFEVSTPSLNEIFLQVAGGQS
jgi:ABC-2 type transport system ATP-binding protein